jgi:hypothetical protein
MEDTNLFPKWPRVAAPPDFEERVMTALARRRRELPQARRSRAFRLSLAGAAAALLASFIGLNVLTGPDGSPSGLARGDASGAPAPLAITEILDYGREARGVSSASRPVYLLEQVSFASNTLAKY